MLFLLLASVFIRKSTQGRSNKIFFASISICIISTSFDIMATLFDNLVGDHTGMVVFSHTVYLVFHTMQASIYTIFIISFLDLWHKVLGKPAARIAIIAPIAIAEALIVTTPFTGLIFSAPGGVYTHGPLFYALYGTAALYAVLGVVLILMNRRLLSKTKIVGLLALICLCFLAVVVHVILPNQRLECFALSLSLFIVSMVVQRPEELIDTDTGLYRHSAYGHYSKNAFMLKKHWHVVMLNIANYTTIQQMLGYEQSNELRKTIADALLRMNKNLGEKGDIYYLDRGRFRIVFPENERNSAETYATLLNNMLKRKINHNGFDITLAPMVVLARCPEEIESFKSLMAFGMDFHERNPYTGRVVLAPEIYHSNDFEVRNNINKIIEKALENRSFRVYYQPIYSVTEGRFSSAEALIRLRDEEHGFISPEILIPAAEKSGAIHKIGEFVFEEVCKFIASEEYKALGLDYIEVNLSVAQCMHGDLADKILSIMQEYNISPKNINLEITETAASYSQRVMMDNLNKLSHAGIEFSLDDYGTGYSNMKRVISLPLKIVKLDKSFVDEQENPKMWIILQNTVKMLKDMNMEIVVEGIETQEMVDVFSDLKCDYIQGYFFSKAISREDFVKFILASKQSSPAE